MYLVTSALRTSPYRLKTEIEVMQKRKLYANMFHMQKIKKKNNL